MVTFLGKVTEKVFGQANGVARKNNREWIAMGYCPRNDGWGPGFLPEFILSEVEWAGMTISDWTTREGLRLKSEVTIRTIY